MASKSSSRPGESRVRELRGRMDQLNLELLALIEQRVQLAVRIGRAKQSLGLPAVDPKREREMCARLSKSASGSLSPAELERVFRAILVASRRAVVRDRRGANRTPRARRK